MRTTYALLLVSFLGVSTGGCAGNDNATSRVSTGLNRLPPERTSRSARTGDYRVEDGDKDLDDEGRAVSIVEDDDLAIRRQYGPEPGLAAREMVGRLIASYYAAAADGNGARACSMLDAGLAGGLTGGQPGSTQNHNRNSCAQALSRLFDERHREVTAAATTLKVLGVHLNGKTGLVELGFKKLPRSQILLEREGGVWKVDALLHSNMP